MKALVEIKRFFRSVKLLLWANLKRDLTFPINIILRLLHPIFYFCLSIFQIFPFYQINNKAFPGLTRDDFIISILLQQLVMFLDFHSFYSLEQTGSKVRSSAFDLIIIKPVNLKIYKYFSAINIDAFVMPVLYILAIIIFGLSYGFGISSLAKYFIFVVICSLVRIIFYSFIMGLSFFVRTIHKITSTNYALFDIAQNPPQIFPSVLRFSLTFLLPYFAIQGNIFYLVAGKHEGLVWSILLFWLFISIVLNSIIWKRGIKKYESIG